MGNSCGVVINRIGKFQMTSNRLAGIVVAIFGLILLFWIIPQHTETVDYGWLRPETLPIIAAVIVIIASVIHILFPTGKVDFDVKLALRAGLFFVVSLLGLFLMHLLGFLLAAPLMILILMLVNSSQSGPVKLMGSSGCKPAS